jgi:hypothetical protein
MEFRYIMVEDQTHPVFMSMETCYALGKTHAPFVMLLHCHSKKGCKRQPFVPVVIIEDCLGHSWEFKKYPSLLDLEQSIIEGKSLESYKSQTSDDK